MLDVPAGSYASYWFVLVLLQILTEAFRRLVRWDQKGPGTRAGRGREGQAWQYHTQALRKQISAQ